MRRLLVVALLSLVVQPARAPASRGTIPGVQGGEPVRIIDADSMTQGPRYCNLAGNVVVARGQLRLSADRMRYDRQSGALEAWGAVEVFDPAFSLTCSRLTFSTRTDEAVAWGNPTLRQKEEEAGGRETFETELTGVQVRVFSRERRVQVLEDVALTRYKVVGGVRVVDLRVRCRSLEALSMARKSSFKGGVAIETPLVGARGERAVFDQVSGKFYIIGRASAWNFDGSGRKINVVRGDKIVYFTREKRTVVIGNVTADVAPEKRTGERRIPVRVSPVVRPGEAMPDE